MSGYFAGSPSPAASGAVATGAPVATRRGVTKIISSVFARSAIRRPNR